MTATWQPPVDEAPTGSVSATETPAEAILRACRMLDELHGVPTLAGARTLDLTRDIRDAARDLHDAANWAVAMLTQELDRQDDEGCDHKVLLDGASVTAVRTPRITSSPEPIGARQEGSTQ